MNIRDVSPAREMFFRNIALKEDKEMYFLVDKTFLVDEEFFFGKEKLDKEVSPQVTAVRLAGASCNRRKIGVGFGGERSIRRSWRSVRIAAGQAPCRVWRAEGGLERGCSRLG
ncbi:hypothetical protein [Streptomyces sp. NPDC051909]|uniref:hypothetical protein n=1 Tax=Streptomyces sp. NPDC051909 TaxID=3154944 RepID=UPI00341414CD